MLSSADAKTSQYGSVQEVLSKFAPHATITRLFARCAFCLCWSAARMRPECAHKGRSGGLKTYCVCFFVAGQRRRRRSGGDTCNTPGLDRLSIPWTSRERLQQSTDFRPTHAATCVRTRLARVWQDRGVAAQVCRVLQFITAFISLKK